METIYGIPHDPRGYTLGEYEMFSGVLWDDMERSVVAHAVELSRLNHEPFSHDFRIRDQMTGRVKIVHGSGRWIYANGRPVALFGYNHAYRLSPEVLAAVDSALAVTALRHASVSPSCPTPNRSCIAAGLTAFAHCASHALHHARG